MTLYTPIVVGFFIGFTANLVSSSEDLPTLKHAPTFVQRPPFANCVPFISFTSIPEFPDDPGCWYPSKQPGILQLASTNHSNTTFPFAAPTSMHLKHTLRHCYQLHMFDSPGAYKQYQLLKLFQSYVAFHVHSVAIFYSVTVTRDVSIFTSRFSALFILVNLTNGTPRMWSCYAEGCKCNSIKLSSSSTSGYNLRKRFSTNRDLRQLAYLPVSCNSNYTKLANEYGLCKFSSHMVDGMAKYFNFTQLPRGYHVPGTSRGHARATEGDGTGSNKTIPCGDSQTPFRIGEPTYTLKTYKLDGSELRFLEGMTTFHLFYCQTEIALAGKDGGAVRWVSGFTWSLWLYVVLYASAVVGIGLLSNRQKSKTAMSYFGDIIRTAVKQGPYGSQFDLKLLILLSPFLVLTTWYESTSTSRVMEPKAAESVPNLEALLNSGYKIFFPEGNISHLFDGGEDRFLDFESGFNHSNQWHRYKDSIFAAGKDSDGKRFGMVNDTSSRKLAMDIPTSNLEHLQIAMRPNFCDIVEQPFFLRTYQWRLRYRNRNLFYKYLTMMRESGISISMSYRLDIAKAKGDVRERREATVREEGYIDIKNGLSGIVMLVVQLLLLSTLICSIEFYLQRHNFILRL